MNKLHISIILAGMRANEKIVEAATQAGIRENSSTSRILAMWAITDYEFLCHEIEKAEENEKIFARKGN